jgi:ribosome-associated translation inhibitor RaiA
MSGHLYFQPATMADINLSWPDEIRKNIEQQIAKAPKVEETLHSLKMVLTNEKYMVYVDGRFVGQINLEKNVDASGTLEIKLY